MRAKMLRIVVLSMFMHRSTHALNCTADKSGLDYPYGDFKMLTGGDQGACCAACAVAGPASCVRWVFSANDTTGGHVAHCWLKKSVAGTPVARADRVSGPGPAAPPTPPTPTPTPAAPAWWSAGYRGWHYYTGGAPDLGGFVVPPVPLMPNGSMVLAGAKLTDCAIAWEAEDRTYRLFYTIFDGTGYRTALARSADLLAWDFSPGLVCDRGAAPGDFDYGGVTFGGPLWENASVTAPRRLRALAAAAGKDKGSKESPRQWVAFGAYPTRGGYEQGDGGEGMAWSEDGGETWHRDSDTLPFVHGAKHGKPGVPQPAWESRVVYQPNLLEHGGIVYDFYNAAGVNAAGAPAEQSGVASLPLADFPGTDAATNSSRWAKYAGNPLLPSGTGAAFDTAMASDPKIFWDEALGAYVMFYFGLGAGSGGHADIMMAKAGHPLGPWEKDPVPLYKAGHHPSGIDAQHAHKISLIYKDGVGFMYYTAVGAKGRGIALLTSEPIE